MEQLEATPGSVENKQKNRSRGERTNDFGRSRGSRSRISARQDMKKQEEKTTSKGSQQKVRNLEEGGSNAPKTNHLEPTKDGIISQPINTQQPNNTTRKDRKSLQSY